MTTPEQLTIPENLIISKPTPALGVTVLDMRDDGYAGTYKHLYVIVSHGTKGDGRIWIHASVSRHDRKTPTYYDLLALKKVAFGDNRPAVQIFPEASRHVDIAGKGPNGVDVLHLWGPVAGDLGLPDMLEGGASL